MSKYPLANIKGRSYEVVPLAKGVKCRTVQGILHVNADATENIDELNRYPVVKHRGQKLRRLDPDARCNIVQGRAVALLPVIKPSENFEELLKVAIPTAEGFTPRASKKFISSVYEGYRRVGGKLDLPAFKEKLWDLHRSEKIDLTRADLISVMDPLKVKASLYQPMQGVNFHFIALGTAGLGAALLMLRKKKNSESSMAGENKTIRRGSTGPEVAKWQEILGVAADGKFGPGTYAATVEWQKKQGLEPDGIVGPLTWLQAQKPRGKVKQALQPLTAGLGNITSDMPLWQKIVGGSLTAGFLYLAATAFKPTRKKG